MEEHLIKEWKNLLKNKRTESLFEEIDHKVFEKLLHFEPTQLVQIEGFPCYLIAKYKGETAFFVIRPEMLGVSVENFNTKQLNDLTKSPYTHLDSWFPENDIERKINTRVFLSQIAREYFDIVKKTQV